MNPVKTTSLNDEIQQMLAGLNMPQEIRAILQQGVEKLREQGVGQGLSVGAMAPDFQLANQASRRVKLSEVLAKGPVVLKFIRGEWCPICNMEVAALKLIAPQLKEIGATLLVINPQKPDKSVVLQDKHALGFDILSDEKQEIIRKFNLQFTVPVPVQEVYKTIGLNLPEHTADGSWNLPVPATFVLDKEGVIHACHVDVNYMRRMEPADILETLRPLR
ncbi:MAG: AhpC/TSA family protein [Acidobacteria bacterium]|nr:AhpC/TSA family protein [Acidobacteriota bacterium]